MKLAAAVAAAAVAAAALAASAFGDDPAVTRPAVATTTTGCPPATFGDVCGLSDSAPTVEDDVACINKELGIGNPMDWPTRCD